MTGSLKGEFEVTSWNETPYAEREGDRKLTRASVTQQLSGGLTGAGEVQWLMSYQQDGTARFVGLQQLEGAIEGRSGSVVVDTVGDFDGKEARGVWTVVPGSGTGEWAGMRGDGGFVAPHGSKASFTLDYSLE
ncbi:MAG TPA: DUF3224 domain-containing protein [Acidimicrobiia bacterium]|jgi:hypothetical protein|nr:DUF3224 domain-containing protein [Acidimicrobiia bacterium]